MSFIILFSTVNKGRTRIAFLNILTVKVPSEFSNRENIKLYDSIISLSKLELSFIYKQKNVTLHNAKFLYIDDVNYSLHLSIL